jgi:hypothetical protein
MRTIARLLILAVLAPVVVGCSWLKSQLNTDQDRQAPRGTGPLEPRSADKFVRYWNMRAARLQSVQYNQVHLRVSGKDVPVPVNLDGNLAAAQPRDFRMTGRGRALAITMDLGSNANEFWMYLQVPGEKPTYVYASHADFEAGRAKLPGGVPFDPDWVMQALGMVTLPENANYDQVSAGSGPVKKFDPVPPAVMSVPRNERDRTYTLAWEVRPAGRPPVRKEIVFDADPALGERPQVKRHLVKDLKGKVLASAEVKAARTIQLNSDPDQAVQYPTHLVLKWEEQKFEMDLTLEGGRDRAQVNHLTPADAGRLFTRRDYPNVGAVDLAGGAFR